MAMRSDLRVESTRGVTLHVHDLGGDGEPLLIAHATGFCGRAYEPLAAALVDHFRVWAMDFRGHGLSDAAPDGDYCWDRMAEDVHAVVGALSTEGVHAFGHSMGGAAVLLAEVRRPGTLRSAYVFEPALLAQEHPPAIVASFGEQARRRTAVFGSPSEARSRLARAFPTWSALSLDAFVEHGLSQQADGSVVLRCAPATEAACYTSPVSSIDDVRGLSIPLTVGAGLVPDHFGAADSARALAAALPHSRLVDYPGLAHFGPFDQPAVVAAAVAAALGKPALLKEER